MNIILCGTDCTFKTTIARKLSSKLGKPIVKGSSFESATGTNKELYKHFLSLTGLNNTIMDRFIYSNRTYATLYPEYTILSDEQRHKIENKIRDNSIVIYLTASVDIICDRLGERGDEHVTTDKIPNIISTYNTVMSDAVDNDIKVYTYDTGILSSGDITSQIIEVLEGVEKSSKTQCVVCKNKTKKTSSYFGQTHCFSCYLKIAADIFRK